MPLQGPVIHSFETRPSFSSDSNLDPDMALCADLRGKGVFLHASNRIQDWGHLVNADDFSTEHVHNELWELERNQWDWEKRWERTISIIKEKWFRTICFLREKANVLHIC